MNDRSARRLSLRQGGVVPLSAAGGCPRTIRRLLPPVGCWLALLFHPLWAAEPDFVLRLKNGSLGVGTLAAAPEPDRLAWLNEGFVRPFLFDVEVVQSIRRTAGQRSTEDANESPRQWLFELQGGGQVCGQIEALDERYLRVHSRLLGPITLERDGVRRVAVDGHGRVLTSGLTDQIWTEPSGQSQWEYRIGQVTTTTPGGKLTGEVELPPRAELRISLSWEGTANFALALGTQAVRQAANQTWATGGPRGERLALGGLRVAVPAQPVGIRHLESAATLLASEGALYVVRELKAAASLAVLPGLDESCSNVDLTIYLDQEAGQVAVLPIGGPLVVLDPVPPAEPATRRQVVLANYGPRLTVERFEVRSWNGRLPHGSVAAQQQLLLRDQQVQAGSIDGWDARARQWIVRGSNGQQRLDGEELLSGELTRLSERDSALDRPTGATESGAEPVRTDGGLLGLVLEDGSRLQVRLLPTGDQRLTFRAVGIEEVLTIDSNGVSELLGSAARLEDTQWAGQSDETTMTAMLGTSQLKGRFAEEMLDERSIPIAWQPTLSHWASPLSPLATGAIRSARWLQPAGKADRQVSEKQPAEAAEARQRIQVQRVNPAIQLVRPLAAMRFLGPVAKADVPPPEPAASPDALSGTGGHFYLRSGESVRAEVHRIDERGVHFQSDQTTKTFALNDAIDRVVLRPAQAVPLSDQERQRLLTVPRARQNDPPTHLLRSVAGDYLRGHAVRMEAGQITIEVRGALMIFPEAEIAEIIWLRGQEAETADDQTDSPTEDSEQQSATAAIESSGSWDSEFWVYASTSDRQGIRLIPRRTEQGRLYGESPELGECTIKLSEVNQLLFGQNIAQEVEQLRSQIYDLEMAALPRVASPSDQTASREHPLVGQPAVVFTLTNLAGESVSLGAPSTQITVLDFWASWCGPCMQSLPQVEALIDELGTDRIRLVAVNLEENRSRVETAVQRLVLHGEVLLDVAGSVAADYQVQAIPHTVVIDREGVITHVFRGGGPQTLAALRSALESLQ